MGVGLKTIIDLLANLVDRIPVLKGYKTVIVLSSLGGLATFDALHIGPGNLYVTYGPYLWPLATVVALAHKVETPLPK